MTMVTVIGDDYSADGNQDDDEVLANVIYDDYRVIVVVHQDLLHSKCILEH